MTHPLYTSVTSWRSVTIIYYWHYASLFLSPVTTNTYIYIADDLLSIYCRLFFLSPLILPTLYLIHRLYLMNDVWNIRFSINIYIYKETYVNRFITQIPISQSVSQSFKIQIDISQFHKFSTFFQFAMDYHILQLWFY